MRRLENVLFLSGRGSNLFTLVVALKMLLIILFPEKQTNKSLKKQETHVIKQKKSKSKPIFISAA